MIGRPSTLDVRVRYAETDQMGVVYHTHYLIWCEVGRTEHIATLGVRYSQLETLGVRLAVAEAEVRYHAPARYDDLIRVETILESVRSRTITFSYVIKHAGNETKLATARTTLVSLDATGRPVALPPAIRHRLEGK
jgi:acyl-CoA thioester hydrolase